MWRHVEITWPSKYYLLFPSNLLSDTLVHRINYRCILLPTFHIEKCLLKWGPCGLSVPFGMGLSVHFVNFKFQGIQIIRCLAGVFFFVNIDLKVMLYTANFKRVSCTARFYFCLWMRVIQLQEHNLFGHFIQGPRSRSIDNLSRVTAPKLYGKLEGAVILT